MIVYIHELMKADDLFKYLNCSVLRHILNIINSDSCLA
jgi:hypothetical protein